MRRFHGGPGLAGEADQRCRRLVELSPDQADHGHGHHAADEAIEQAPGALRCEQWRQPPGAVAEAVEPQRRGEHGAEREGEPLVAGVARGDATEQHHGIEIDRSEEHTSELQSLMRISYAVFCLKKKKQKPQSKIYHTLRHTSM